MTVACTVTLSFNNQEAREQEVQLVERALRIFAGDIRRSGGAQASGTIVDGPFGVLGTWTYTAGAAS
jgi:hypothetical protein